MSNNSKNNVLYDNKGTNVQLKLSYMEEADRLLDHLGCELIPNEGDMVIFDRDNQPMITLRIYGGETEDYHIASITAKSGEYCDYEALLRYKDNADEYHMVEMDQDFFNEIGNQVTAISDKLLSESNFKYSIASPPYSNLDYLQLLTSSPKFFDVNRKLRTANQDGHVVIPVGGSLFLHYNASCDRDENNQPNGLWKYSIQTYNHRELIKDGLPDLRYEFGSDIFTIAVSKPLESEDICFRVHSSWIEDYQRKMRNLIDKAAENSELAYEIYRSASIYSRYRFPRKADVSNVAIYKNRQGDWIVRVCLGNGIETKGHILSKDDKQALFCLKTASKEQIAAKHCNEDIKALLRDDKEQQKAGRGLKL